MSVSALILPPQLSKDTTYENYKKELDIWKLLKSCSEEEQGPIVFRTLTGKAKSAALELTTQEIGAKDGLSKILGKLDRLYLADDNQRTCAILEKFESFKRSSTQTMSSFILEFEGLHNQLKNYGCTYPDGVLAFRLMKNANMSRDAPGHVPVRPGQQFRPFSLSRPGVPARPKIGRDNRDKRDNIFFCLK